MRAPVLAAAVIAAGWAAASAADTPGDASPDRVERLIADLGSGAFRHREAATRELDALGAAALPALRRAATSADPETRRRATDLVGRISDRLAAARILAPTAVAFDYKDKPLTDAVADLARRTGANVTLHDPVPNKFKDRRVTAATPGPVPFWEAVELFCRKADLHEWEGLTPVSGLATPQPATQIVGQGGFGGRIIVRGQGTIRSGVGPAPGQTVLLDGPGVPASVHHAGAVRVRFLPPGTPCAVAPVGVDEAILPIQVSAEPKLHWQGASELRIDRAVDDRGRPLATSVAVPSVPANENGMVVINGMVMQAPAHRPGPVGVRVKRGDGLAKRVAELAGSIAAPVQVAEPLAVVDAPLSAVGQSVRGDHGVTLKLVAAARADDGTVKVLVEVRLPPDVQLAAAGGVVGVPMGGAMQFQQIPGGIIMQQVMIGPGGVAPPAAPVPAGTTDFQGLSLEDAQGRRCAVTGGRYEMNRLGPDGSTFQFSATFRPADPGQAPARLVFTAMRPATLQVPFVVKDVPLP